MLPEIPEFLAEMKVYSVSELTSIIKDKLANEPKLQHIAVRGEVSNMTKSSAGHIYFSLKDIGSVIKCVAFRSRAERIRFSPREGDEVIVFGSIDVYPQGGSYQLYIDEIFSAGRGELYARYIELKETLEKEGLFDSSRKKPIPEFPHVIGVVTSPKGAAIRDILKILARQAPHIVIVISPTLVQGIDAPPKIIEALDRLLSIDPRPDTVILARGGGSFEDLFCFNDESLVRYISDYPIPIITGVGHETDATLVDYVSDHRSSTPTGAAHDATPDRDMLAEEVISIAQQLADFLKEGIKGYREIIDEIISRSVFQYPERRWMAFYQEIDFIKDRLARTITTRLISNKSEVQNILAILNHTNPMKLLEKGYAIAHRAFDDKLLRDVNDLSEGEQVRVRLHKGKFTAKVERTEN
jgi:exodeoxyribonuclease VII large subunit